VNQSPIVPAPPPRAPVPGGPALAPSAPPPPAGVPSSPGALSLAFSTGFGREGCESSVGLSHPGSGTSVALYGPAPASGRHWSRRLCTPPPGTGGALPHLWDGRMSGRGKLDYPAVDEEVIGTEQLMGRRQDPAAR
jgi:hypothetical protein